MLAPRAMNGLLNLACLPADAIPRAAREMARLSLFDWLTVARAGAQEPVAKILCGLVEDEAGKPAASVVGLSIKVPARAAALANGTISHALDGIVRVNSILPAGVPGQPGSPLFLFTNYQRAWPDSTPKIAYTCLP